MQYDYIIIGAGMGGLSAANFLAKYGKKVLVLEKHRIPGGLVTSFARKGVHFDLGIHGLYELQDGQAIPQFLEFWGAPPVETVPLCGDLKCFIDGRAFVFRSGQVRGDFRDQFPEHRDDVDQLFDAMETINREMFSGTEAPEPPYDMNLLELVRFGLKARKRMPVFMKYGNKDACRILDGFTSCDELKTAIYSRGPYPMVFMSFAYQWGVQGQGRYPAGGMQAIPDAAVESLRRLGGELRLNTEVAEILVKDGRAHGVRTRDGATCHGAVISNASPQFTGTWLPDRERVQLEKTFAGRRLFEPVAALFLAVDEQRHDLGGLEAVSILSRPDYRMETAEYTPETAPIVINVYPRRAGDAFRPLVALAPLSYQYRHCWETGDGKERGEAYRQLKKDVEQVLLDRIGARMGSGFMSAVVHHELSTPLTFERYTYSKDGSFMGWSINQGSYGKYLNQRTPVKDLHLVGQWVFPGFGVAGVMASGYYLARSLLKREGIDLKKDFAQYFGNGG